MFPVLSIDILARQAFADLADLIGYFVENETPYPFDPDTFREGFDTLLLCDAVTTVVKVQSPEQSDARKQAFRRSIEEFKEQARKAS